jgi:hypothetical protein
MLEVAHLLRPVRQSAFVGDFQEGVFCQTSGLWIVIPPAGLLPH